MKSKRTVDQVIAKIESNPIRTVQDGSDREDVGILYREVKRLRERCEALAEASQGIYELAGWHTDDSADPNDQSPEDAAAHTNGLIRRICLAALDQQDQAAGDSLVESTEIISKPGDSIQCTQINLSTEAKDRMKVPDKTFDDQQDQQGPDYLNCPGCGDKSNRENNPNHLLGMGVQAESGVCGL